MLHFKIHLLYFSFILSCIIVNHFIVVDIKALSSFDNDQRGMISN